MQARLLAPITPVWSLHLELPYYSESSLATFFPPFPRQQTLAAAASPPAGNSRISSGIVCSRRDARGKAERCACLCTWRRRRPFLPSTGFLQVYTLFARTEGKKEGEADSVYSTYFIARGVLRYTRENSVVTNFRYVCIYTAIRAPLHSLLARGHRILKDACVLLNMSCNKFRGWIVQIIFRWIYLEIDWQKSILPKVHCSAYFLIFQEASIFRLNIIIIIVINKWTIELINLHIEPFRVVTISDVHITQI